MVVYILFIYIFRCHVKYAAHPCISGRDGLASDSAPHKLRPWKLPSAQRQSIHLEEGMSCGDGEVRQKTAPSEKLSQKHFKIGYHKMHFFSSNHDKNRLVQLTVQCLHFVLSAAISVIISIQMKPNERKSPTPATLLFRNQVETLLCLNVNIYCTKNCILYLHFHNHPA